MLMCRSVRNTVLSVFVLLLVLFTSSVAFAADYLQPDLSGVDLNYPYYVGSLWIKAHDSVLGDVEIYIPTSAYDSFGLNSSGYLVNITSSSVGGMLYDSSGHSYNFSCSGFSLPRYRLSNSTGYQYTDGNFSVVDSNANIAYRFDNRTPFSVSYPYIIIGMIGVIFVCLMRYKR